MGHYVQTDLSTQQHALIGRDYDLRVTNLARFLQRIIPKKRGKLIDIGAGNGLLLKFFRDKGFAVTGMELSPSLTRNMKRDPLLKGVSIRQGDISKLRGKQEYDVVIASDVIEHIENDVAALKNLFSFVAPGGILVITVPAFSYLYGTRDRLWGHYRRYDKRDFIRKLSTLHGDIERTSYWNFLGVLVYFFFEKVLRKQVNEKLRYTTSFTGSVLRHLVEWELQVEQMLGGTPVGLTLVCVIRKRRAT